MQKEQHTSGIDWNRPTEQHAYLLTFVISCILTHRHKVLGSWIKKSRCYYSPTYQSWTRRDWSSWH